MKLTQADIELQAAELSLDAWLKHHAEINRQLAEVEAEIDRARKRVEAARAALKKGSDK